MNEHEQKIVMLRAYIKQRVEYLSQLIFHHECNIPVPTMDEAYDYAHAIGEKKASMELYAMMEVQG